ncbi:MAG: hypothetical protein MZW92_46260 [Comamonadaceae bacterium]|nr:hypothetical protein [Comamonadaceae bacterium]
MMQIALVCVILAAAGRRHGLDRRGEFADLCGAGHHRGQRRPLPVDVDRARAGRVSPASKEGRQ